MRLIKRLSIARDILFRGLEPYDEEKWLSILSGGPTKAGPLIGESNTLTISAIFAGLNVIASTIASIPKTIRRRLPEGGSEDAADHPLYDLVRNKPNSSNMSAWSMTYSQILHKYLWGNMYTWHKMKSFRNRELIPLMPDVTRIDPMNKNAYTTQLDGKTYTLSAGEVLHIPHISMNGITGKGFIHYARESLGIARAVEDFAAAYFGNGVHPSGIVETEKPLEDKDKTRVKEDFVQKYSGLGNAFRVIFLGGAKFHQLEIDAEKMQGLQSRQFTVLEAARWLNLPPHILRDLSRATFSNIEHQSTELVMYTFLPLVAQLEKAENLIYFDEEERKDYYIKYELKGLLRGDLATRTNFYTQMLDRGVFNADDVLELEDMNPQPDGLGKIYLTQLNMVNKATMKKAPVQKEKVLQITDESGMQPDEQQPEAQETKQTATRIEKRSSLLRRKITLAYKSKFEEYAHSILESEIEEIRQRTSEDLPGFIAGVKDFYSSFSDQIRSQALPLISSYSTAILPVTQDEIGSASDISAVYQRFLVDYIDYLVLRHTSESIQTIRKTFPSDLLEEDAQRALEGILSDWTASRASRITEHEMIRSENAFSRMVFESCGITKIRCKAYSKDNPYCAALDGKEIDINASFLEPGYFQPPGATQAIYISSARKHPPFFPGDDSGIEAVIQGA